VNASTVACPYCLGELACAALACRHCGREVGHLLPMIFRQQALANEVDRLRAQLAELVARPAPAPAVEPVAAASAGDASRQPEPAEVGLLRRPVTASERSPAAVAAAAVLVVTTVSALLHWLLLFVYDAPPLLLRVLTLCAPFALGARASRLAPASPTLHALAAVACGLAAVGAMLSITHLIDGTPLLPQDARELREALEYCASIALAFLAGSLLSRHYRLAARPRVAMPPGALVGYAQRFQQLASLLSPICAGALAFYSGLKGLVGD